MMHLVSEAHNSGLMGGGRRFSSEDGDGRCSVACHGQPVG